MVEWFRRTRRTWRYLAQTGVVIFAVVSPFVIPPPVDQLIGGAQVLPGIARFAIAVLLVLMFFIGVISSDAYRWLWFAATFSLLLLSLGTLVAYIAVQAQWTCSYGTNRVVVGASYIDAARKYSTEFEEKQHRPLSCEEMILHSAGDLTTIWDADQMSRRSLVLAILYLGTVGAFAMTLIAAVQTAYYAAAIAPEAHGR